MECMGEFLTAIAGLLMIPVVALTLAASFFSMFKFWSLLARWFGDSTE